MGWRVGDNKSEGFEWYNFETKEEAIEFGKQEYKDKDLEFFYIGVYKEFEDSICGEVLLERQSEYAQDEFIDFADGYLDDCEKEHVKELENSLTKVFREWQDKYNYKPNFGTVINIEKVYLK